MKMESIRLDILDGKDEPLFRIHGYNDMLDSSDPVEAITFIAEQLVEILTDIGKLETDYASSS